MFTVDNYTFHFHHNVEERTSTAVVLIGEDKKLYAIANAFCNPTDQFNRSIGRKVSLQHLLKELACHDLKFDDKEYRKKIWDEYFKHVKKG